MVSATATTAQTSGFVYTLQHVDGGANQIHGFRLHPVSGALTALAGFPVATGGTGSGVQASEQLVADEVNDRLFAVNDGSDSLSVFSVDRFTGALTAMSYSPLPLGTGEWTCAAVHMAGSPVVVGNGAAAATLVSYNMNTLTPVPAAGSPYTTGAARPFSCQMNGAGNYVYTGGNLGSAMAGFVLNAISGVLTPLAGSPFNAGNDYPMAYASDTSGRLYLMHSTIDVARVFTTAGGVPTGVTGNPFPGMGVGGMAFRGVWHSGGYYMVADRNSNVIGVKRIQGTSTSTTISNVAGSPFASGGSTTSMLALSATTGLVAGHSDSRNLTVFRVTPATGALVSLGTQPVNTLGAAGRLSGLVFMPNALGFVYALQNEVGVANRIHGYRVTSAGATHALSGFPRTTGVSSFVSTGPEFFRYHDGRLYVVNDGSQTLSAYTVNRTTGALTEMPYSPLSLGQGFWRCVAVHPSGSPVVVGSSTSFFNNPRIASFNVTASTAVAAAGSPYPTSASNHTNCAFSRDGGYLHTNSAIAVGPSSELSGYSVAAATGVLTALSGSPFTIPTVVSGMAADVSGRLFGAGTSALYAFTTPSGAPTGVTGNPFPQGSSAQFVHGVVHPSGYYLAVDSANHAIGVHQIAGTGAATSLSGVPGSTAIDTQGTAPRPLALTPDGAFVIAANRNSRNLTMFQFLSTTGSLTFARVMPADSLGTSGFVEGLAFAPYLGTAQTFTNDPLLARSTSIRAVHVTELRTRVDGIRQLYGLTAFAWTDSTLTVGVSAVRVAHITELRTALNDAYAVALLPPPAYTDATLAAGIAIKAIHLTELRAAILAIE